MLKRDWRNINGLISGLLLLIIACNVGMLLFYGCVTYRSLMHSDAAALNMMADEMYRTGQLFPSEWNYPNGDLWVFFGHLFILPLLPFVKNGFAMHAVAAVVTAALILLGVWLLAKVLEIHIALRLVLMAVLTSGVSHFFAEQVFGQLTYGTVLSLLLFQFYFFFRYWKSVESEHPDGWALVGFCSVLFIVFLSNPSRALATNLAPFIAGFFFWSIHLISTRRWPNQRFLLHVLGKPALITGAVILAGGIGHGIILTQTNYQVGAANAEYIAQTDVVRNLLGTLRGWFNIVGGLPSDKENVISIRGIRRAYGMLAASCLLVFPIYLWRTLLNQRNDILRFFTVSVFTTFCIALFFQLFTTVPEMRSLDGEIQSARYLVVTVFMVALSAVLLLNKRMLVEQPWNIPLAATICLFPFMVSGFFTLVKPGLVMQHSSFWKSTRTPSPMDGVINRLEAENLHYGYSSYWNANLTTVLSKGSQKIRAIHVTPIPIPMPHLSSNDWYRPSAHKGPVFFLFTAEEYAGINWVDMAAYLGAPSRVLNEGKWRIVVYPYNISSRLPGWDSKLTEPLTFAWLSTTPHQVGRSENTADGTLRVSGAGEDGYLAYGPYVRLAKGQYEVIFEIDAVGPRGALAEVNVAAGGGDTLAKAEVSNATGWQKFALPFTNATNDTAFEFRVLTYGQGTVRAKAIVLKRLDSEKK